MIEQFNSINWDVYRDIFTFGDPPVYIQLLIFAGLILVYWLWRKLTQAPSLSKFKKLKYKILVFAITFAILFQEEYNLSGKIDTIKDAFGL